MNKSEENDLIDSVENGEWTSVSNLDEMKEKFVRAAAETALKEYKFNGRISAPRSLHESE